MLTYKLKGKNVNKTYNVHIDTFMSFTVSEHEPFGIDLIYNFGSLMTACFQIIEKPDLLYWDRF